MANRRKIESIFLLALGVCVLARPALAETRGARPATATQANESPVTTAAVLSRTFEEKAREILERYIPLREFQVAVTVTPNGKNIPRAPYEPKSISSGSTLNMTPEELSAFIARVSIEVLLTARLNTSKKRIEELLTRGLDLQRNRGDRINFGPLGIEIDSDEWRKEKTDLKREMEILKNENARLTQELAKPGAKDKDGKPLMNGEDSLMKQDWFWPAVVGGACMILLIGLITIGRSFFTAGRSLAGSISNVATAMERIGGAMGVSGANGSGSGIQSLEAKLLSDGNGGKGMASLPMEAIHSHLLKLRHEILESLSDGSESIILRQLTQLLSKPETVGRGVVTLELLGRDTATEMFRRLGLKSQEAVMVFLRTGIYGGSKIEMMLEAAEELKTKLLVESLEHLRGRPSEKVAQRLIQLSEDELTQVALDLDSEFIPRLFLYLDAPKISMLLARIKPLNPDKFEAILNALPKMPTAAANSGNDDNIAVALDNVIERTRNDAQRPFLQVYQDIVEAADEEISEHIVRQLSNDPRLDAHFRQNVISVHTFFVLTHEVRNEIIESLSNKDIAALAAGSKSDEQQLLLDAVPERRKSMVAEEFESLTARGGRQMQYAYKRVREIIVKRLKEMKNDGTLVVAKAPSASPAAIGSGAGGGRPRASGGGTPRPRRPVREPPSAVPPPPPPPPPPATEQAGAEPTGPGTLNEEPSKLNELEPPRRRGKKAA